MPSSPDPTQDRAQTLKNRILLENDYPPGDLAQIGASPSTTITDAITEGRSQTILLERERIKRATIKQQGLKHHSKAA